MKNKITYEDAKALLDEGFSVFPVLIHWNGEKFEKKPAVAWKEYQDRLPTDEELHGWFDNGNYNAIGLATGHVSGVVVVDVEKGGLEDAKGIDSERISNTISGGKHFFYEAPKEKIGNTVRIGGKQMDFRGDGGFVVVPPSFCDKDGQRYEYTWEKECPDFLLKPLPDLTGDWTEVKEPLKLDSLTHKGQGERNDSLYRSACSLLAKYDTDEAWRLVGDINRTYEPPLPDHEVRTLFQSAVNFIGKKDTNKTEDDDILVGEPIQWSKIKEDDLRRDWLWENFIAKGNITLLSALAKAGKTTLLRCLFVAMKNGEEFAGQPTRKNNILVLSEESPSEWADSREGVEDDDIEHVLIWSRPTRGIPSKSEWSKVIDGVSKTCTERKIDLVVVDTISTFWPVENENDASMVKRALVPLFKLTEDNGVALVLVHHFKKGGGDQGQASRGSTALVGHVDNIIEFRRNDDGTPSQRRLKTMGRFVRETEIIIELNKDGMYETKGEPWVVSKSARMDKLLSLVSESPKPLSSAEISSLWDSRVSKIDSRTIRNYVSELVKEKRLISSGAEIVNGKTVPVYTTGTWKKSEGGNVLWD